LQPFGKLGRNMYFYTAVQAILNIIHPFAMLLIPKYIFDELVGKQRIDIVLKYVIIYAIAMIFFNTITVLLNKYMSIESIKCTHEIEMHDQKEWLYVDYANLENGQVRELAERSIEKIDPVTFIQKYVFGFVTRALQLGGYTYIISEIHPLIVIGILSVVGVNVLIARKLNKINYTYEPLLTHISRRYLYIYDMMLGIKGGQELRINGASKWFLKKYENETLRYTKVYQEKQRNAFIYNVLTFVIGGTQMVLIYGYCAYLAISGGITIGSFTVFLGAVTAFTSSFTEFVKLFPELVLLSSYVEDYKTFIDIITPKARGQEGLGANKPINGNCDIEFVNVYFRYPNTQRYVLKNINIKIKAGERLSVVGYNGAGKSTFIKLICRLYEPTMGQILVGGIDIKTIDIAEYRKILSVVFQDYQLFWTSTIRNNIVLNQKYDEEHFVDSVNKSGLSESVPLLKRGFDTVLECIYDEEGIRFSGGEEQKVACARAYYKESCVVILDEPTASLDPIAESKLYERFNSIIGDKTSIYISHRLASVKFCDSIAMFVDGELIERGTHNELMQKNGIYADMFKKQADYYVK